MSLVILRVARRRRLQAYGIIHIMMTSQTASIRVRNLSLQVCVCRACAIKRGYINQILIIYLQVYLYNQRGKERALQIYYQSAWNGKGAA